MITKNSACTVTYIAWDTGANTPKTGDNANHTLRIVKDGTEATPAASPAEVDATNAPGVYKLALAAGETNCDVLRLAGKSSTAGVVLIGWETQTALPIVVNPVVASQAVANLVPAALSLQMFANEAKTFSLTVLDAAGTPVSLAGKTLRLIVQPVSNTPTATFKVENAAMTVSGLSNEIANVPISHTQSAIAPDTYAWRLWDVTPNVVLANGTIKILPSTDNA